MAKQIVLLLCTFISFSSAWIAPRDLADEAAEQLEQLNITLWGQISAAHNKLEDARQEFAAKTNMDYENIKVDLEQEYETIESQLATIVDLAISGGYDVSTCTNYGEDTLLELLNQYYYDIYSDCLVSVHYDMNQYVKDAKYLIDVTITKVEHLNDQLQKCRGDALCISPLVAQIELYRISLVGEIEEEVQTTENQISLLAVVLDSCSESKCADYVEEANSILGDITACIDRILG